MSLRYWSYCWPYWSPAVVEEPPRPQLLPTTRSRIRDRPLLRHRRYQPRQCHRLPRSIRCRWCAPATTHTALCRPLTTQDKPRSVQALYNGLLALPKYVPGQVTCPSDIGVQYNLKFTHNGAVVLLAIADPTGCQIVVVNGHDNRTAAIVNSGHFWQMPSASRRLWSIRLPLHRTSYGAIGPAGWLPLSPAVPERRSLSGFGDPEIAAWCWQSPGLIVSFRLELSYAAQNPGLDIPKLREWSTHWPTNA